MKKMMRQKILTGVLVLSMVIPQQLLGLSWGAVSSSKLLITSLNQYFPENTNVYAEFKANEADVKVVLEFIDDAIASRTSTRTDDPAAAPALKLSEEFDHYFYPEMAIGAVYKTSKSTTENSAQGKINTSNVSDASVLALAKLFPMVVPKIPESSIEVSEIPTSEPQKNNRATSKKLDLPLDLLIVIRAKTALLEEKVLESKEAFQVTNLPSEGDGAIAPRIYFSEKSSVGFAFDGDKVMLSNKFNMLLNALKNKNDASKTLVPSREFNSLLAKLPKNRLGTFIINRKLGALQSQIEDVLGPLSKDPSSPKISGFFTGYIDFIKTMYTMIGPEYSTQAVMAISHNKDKKWFDLNAYVLVPDSNKIPDKKMREVLNAYYSTQDDQDANLSSVLSDKTTAFIGVNQLDATLKMLLHVYAGTEKGQGNIDEFNKYLGVFNVDLEKNMIALFNGTSAFSWNGPLVSTVKNSVPDFSFLLSQSDNTKDMFEATDLPTLVIGEIKKKRLYGLPFFVTKEKNAKKSGQIYFGSLNSQFYGAGATQFLASSPLLSRGPSLAASPDFQVLSQGIDKPLKMFGYFDFVKAFPAASETIPLKALLMTAKCESMQCHGLYRLKY